MKNLDNKKAIIIISCTLIVLLILLIVIKIVVSKQRDEEKIIEQINSYTSIDDFKTIEEVAKYLECDFIKQTNSREKEYDIDIYMKIKVTPYIEDESNERFYDKLILYSANVLKYQSFRIIDKKNDITIEVVCDKENKTIKNKIINGEINYFAKHDSYIEMKNMESTKETNFNIQSSILEKVIQNDWKDIKEEFGTKESIFNQYDIYFDEGIEVRKVSDKIFNIIFTENYKEDIVNDIKTSTSKENIIKILGEPTFSNEQFDFIGYKGKDIYLFYNSRKEISIYRVEKDYDSTRFAQIVDNYLENKDQEKLVKDIKEEYGDFDVYDNSSQGTILQYTLKGIQINFRKGVSSGIQIYKNYSGTIYKDINLETIKNNKELPDNIFVNNQDLVEKREIERLENIDMIITNLNIERKNSKEETSQSNMFYTLKTKMSGNSYKIQFISIDGKNANSELRESVDYYIWIDDYNFIYSVKNKGIYLYNLKLRKYAEIVTGKNEEFKIIEYKDKILKYDDKSIRLLK